MTFLSKRFKSQKNATPWLDFLGECSDVIQEKFGYNKEQPVYDGWYLLSKEHDENSKMPQGCCFEIESHLVPKLQFQIDVKDEKLTAKFGEAVAALKTPLPERVRILEKHKSGHSYSLVMHTREGMAYPTAIQASKITGNPASYNARLVQAQSMGHDDQTTVAPESTGTLSTANLEVGAASTQDSRTGSSGGGTAFSAPYSEISLFPPQLKVNTGAAFGIPFGFGEQESPHSGVDPKKLHTPPIQPSRNLRQVSLVNPSEDRYDPSYGGFTAEFIQEQSDETEITRDSQTSSGNSAGGVTRTLTFHRVARE